MNDVKNFLLIFLSLIPLYRCQGIAQPTLTGITAINSSAVNVTWQFANPTYDQSDSIQISIAFKEFAYNNYSRDYPSINYTFTATSKNITSLTRSFELINAFYYICFSSNSTITNRSTSLFRQTCQLTRTCTRANTNCGQASLVVISTANVLSNSFIINVQWLPNLQYTPGLISVQRIDNNASGVLLTPALASNMSYRFSGLKANTNYVVNVNTTYTLFNASMTNTMNYSVTTSRSSTFPSTSHLFSLLVWSMIFFGLFA